MESCHSVKLPPLVRHVPHPPAYHRLPHKIYSTLGHLMDILEQLSSREDLSSLLQGIVAEGDDQNPQANSRGSRLDLDPATIIKVAQILRNFNAKGVTMATENHGTTNVASSATLVAVSEETPGSKGGERAPRALDGQMSLSKQDSMYLAKKIRDFEQKCKPLQEKNKKFLERNMELTTQNRNLKEQIRSIAEENKKMKESLDQSRKKCSLLTRQVSTEKQEKGALEEQVQEMTKLRIQLSEQAKLVESLKHTLAEKDRRVEVLQHRKQRRLRMSSEHVTRLSSPCSIAEDDRSLDSSFNSSLNSSISTGACSDEDLLDEQSPQEQLDKERKRYKQMMKEHLSLQKSMAQLQGMLGYKSDPQRYLKMKTDFETDLYIAQCKIENLEECLEKYKDSDQSWVLEKEELCNKNQKLTNEMHTLSVHYQALASENLALKTKVEDLDDSLKDINRSYDDAVEQLEQMEFLVLETQECKESDVPVTCTVATTTDDLEPELRTEDQKTTEPRAESRSGTTLQEALNMAAGNHQQAYRATIHGLEEKLTKLLQGQGSEVNTVLSQLRQAEQHVSEVEVSMQELQDKIVALQEEKLDLSDRLTRYKTKLDSQEQDLSLTRDEREELLQVKNKGAETFLNSRLRLAEMGQGALRGRLLERERSQERIGSPTATPQSPPQPQQSSSESLVTGSQTDAEIQERFEPEVSQSVEIEPVSFGNQSPRRTRIHSVPVIGSGQVIHFETSSEDDMLQKKITELQEENDVLKYELMQKCDRDSDASGSDSEDSKLVELRETIENLRERLQSSELAEKQYRDRLKLAEKHITELELGESVLRDRVEEGNVDCDKLRKQIVRLQRKIRELKEVATDKEAHEQALSEKVKFLTEAESLLSEKVTELEGTNQILQQRLDLKEELLADVHLMTALKEKVTQLEAENNDLGSKVLDLEEDNEILRDNWSKVADEEANRRECLEEKIRILEISNSEMKEKLKESETDLNLSSCPSIASEINEDTIEQLNLRIKELEKELEKCAEEKDEMIASLQEQLDDIKTSEIKLAETLIEMENSERQLKNQIAALETSAESRQAASQILSYEDKIVQLRSSQEDLLEKMDSMEDHEDDLKQRLIDMEKSYEKKLEMLEREIAEFQQQEDDLCVRIQEFEDIEALQAKKIESLKETEAELNKRVEEYENREMDLTVSFSKRIEALEQNDKEVTEKFSMRIQELECKEGDLHKKIDQLEKEKQGLLGKVSELEKHEKELSEKVLISNEEHIHHDQENTELHSKALSSNGRTTLQLQNTVQTYAKVESDATTSLTLKADNKIEDVNEIEVQTENDTQKLNEEIKMLTIKLEEAEREQKSLSDKLRKVEKKRKKSQRTDNLEDYDTLAREVVTFKIEVDQLRTENSDLHDRLIELDESEKVLLEKNEELANELSKSNNEKEKVLTERIEELESVEMSLRNEIASLKATKLESDILHKQPSIDSAYGSNKESDKETVDKQVGTDDFMEGVMGQEQGKPVSSMFCRIQTLETENLELSAKLSALTATDAQVRQLSEKVKGLEENEDSLMERVMELEEEEDRLTRELNKARKSIDALAEVEDELLALQETEKEIKLKVEDLQSENNMLKKTIESSGMEKGDIAVRYASTQKLYEDEKKKVESLLKGEERWMKSTASDKKLIQEMEQELSNTQDKLEELQTDYENKLSEKDDKEKVLSDEINKLIRDKELNKKKMQEYANSNSELEDEIEACKISESRMFHKHQQLITQNEELEIKLSKLLQYLPALTDKVPENIVDSKVSQMSENPELVSESPLTVSIFNDKELDLLRSKTPDTELLGSVPLDMLRKMEEFDQRESNYQTKIQEYETKNAKLVRSVKVLQGREKDLKHEIKELQVELLNIKEPSSSLRASTSSVDLDRSGSDEGLDSCDNLSTEGNDDPVDIFKLEEKLSSGTSQYDKMSREQLLLSVRLFEEKQTQEQKKLEDLEEWVSTAKDLLKHMVEVMVSEPLETYIQSVGAFKDTMEAQKDQCEGIPQPLLGALQAVTSLRQRLQALQNSEERLRLSLAEIELVNENHAAEAEMRIKQLEAQVHLLEQLTEREAEESKPEAVKVEDTAIQSGSDLVTRVGSPDRTLQLEASKTITIDVPPQGREAELYKLGQSETITVNVAAGELEAEDEQTEADNNQWPIMMEKAEDVLRQRIKELEKLEKHLKQQVQDLETDREELHDIARKDKNIIHEQNVRLRELQLSQRNLQEQVKSFENSENTLYNRLDELETEIQIKDDRIRDLEILEQRLKDLVKQYRLDEKILATKSQTLESSVKEMTDKEVTLKQKLQNLESEKFAFSERSEYLQMRLKELENAELDLAQRSKNQENIMQSLQNTVMELETFGANAQARVVELEQINFDLQQRLHFSMTENSPLSKQYAVVQQQCDNMASELSSLRDLEIKLRQENEALMKSEMTLQQDVKVLRLNEVELEAKVRDLSESESHMKDRVSKLQRSENTLKYRVQELENSGIQAPSDLENGMTENVKLPRTLEDCQRRIIMLQSHNAELQSRLQQGQTGSLSGPSKGHVITVPQAEYQSLQKKVKVLEQTEGQLFESDRLNTHLQDTIAQLREGKDVCGHEVEVDVLRERLQQANQSVQILQDQSSGQWISQGPNGFSGSPGNATANSLSPGQQMLVNSFPEEEEEESEEWITPSQGTQQEMIAKVMSQGHTLSRERLMMDLVAQGQQGPGLIRPEDDKWREIETLLEKNSRGSEQWISIGKAQSVFAAERRAGSVPNLYRSHGKDEELEVAVTLQSETESQPYSQNDTDSGRYLDGNSAQVQMRRQPELYARMEGNSLESRAPPLPQQGTKMAAGSKVTDSFGESLYVQDSLDEVPDPSREVHGHGTVSHWYPGSTHSTIDSIPDSGRGTNSVSMATSGLTLRERIAHIERQLSARESDSAREHKSELDLTSWKAKVNESNRRLELFEKENKSYKDEQLKTRPAYRRKMKINKLEKELEEKTRQLLLLDAFLTTTETILNDKNTSDGGIRSKLMKEVENLRESQPSITHRPTDGTMDITALQSDMAKKDRELSAKRNEVDGLTRELRQWQTECRTLEDMRSNALDSLRGLELEISDLQLADKQLKVLKEEHNMLKGQFSKLADAYTKLDKVRQQMDDISTERDDLDIEATGLRSKVARLEGQVAVLRGLHKEKRELDEKLIEVRDELADYQRNNTSVVSVEKNLQIVTDLLNERMKKVESLTEENFELRKKLSMLDRENYKQRQQMGPIKMDTGSIYSNKRRTAEEARGRSQGSPVVVTALRSKVVQLTNLCNEKDMLIKKLVQELKKLKSGAKSSPLIDELCRLESKSDHNHNRLGRSSSQSSLESGEHVSYVSDTELIRDTSSPLHLQRPRSADVYQNRNAGHRHSYHGPHRSHLPRIYGNHSNPGTPSRSLYTGDRKRDISDQTSRGYGGYSNRPLGHFVAVADYDPSMFSHSGHQRLELSLKEGDLVTVTGAIDQSGYYEGEVKGQVGLVPASYLKPAPTSRVMGQQAVPGYLNASPERISQMYNHLVSTHRPDTQGHTAPHGLPNGHPASSRVFDAQFLPSTMMPGPPQVPANFHVEKIIGNSSLLLAWQPLTLDNSGCNNGVKITGYRIFKNNKILAQPRGTQANKTIVENIDIHAHHRFGIQTVSADGQVSELSEVMYEGVEEVTSDENSDTESEMDMSAVLDMDAYTSGPKRMFMGVYDYDPHKNSPQDHPSCELTFSAGDVISVYGRQRSDGFYHGEINAIRGLVPAFFIEEMPQPPPRTKKKSKKQTSKENKSSTDKQES